jgi:hypothetical protein
VSFDAWINNSVKHVQVLLEQGPLLIVNGHDDVIVVPDNEHHIFSENSKLVFSLQKLHNIVRDVHDTKSLDDSPVLAFNQHFVEFTIEIALQNTVLLRSLEQGVVGDSNRKLLLLGFRSNEDWNFKLRVNVDRVHVSNIILPALEICVVDRRVKLVSELGVLFDGILLSLILWDEVEVLKSGLRFVDADNQTVGPDSKTSPFWVREWHWWWSLILGLKSLFNLFDLGQEELVNHIGGLFVHVVNDKRSLGQGVEVLQHLNSI